MPHGHRPPRRHGADRHGQRRGVTVDGDDDLQHTIVVTSGRPLVLTAPAGA